MFVTTRRQCERHDRISQYSVELIVEFFVLDKRASILYYSLLLRLSSETSVTGYPRPQKTLRRPRRQSSELASESNIPTSYGARVVSTDAYRLHTGLFANTRSKLNNMFPAYQLPMRLLLQPAYRRGLGRGGT